MKIWHIRNQGYSKAFAGPTTYKECILLYLRGWRKFSPSWWTKPGRNLKQK